MTPLVSILIPVYNARPWVAQAIESALAQTWPNKEVIVLDDGSTDGSIEVIQPYAGRVRVESAKNGGQNVSRNRLTAMSRGDWLIYLDADDELVPDNVAQKMKFAADAEAIYGSMDTVTFQGREAVRSEKRPAEEYPDPLKAAMWWAYPNTSSLAFRRTALLAAGGWDESVKNCTDYALYLPMLLRGDRFRAAPDAWTVYRMWSATQAVNEAPIRKMTTRLRLMRTTVEAMKRTGQLTPEREQAYFDAALGGIRLLHLHDSAAASGEHRALREWNPQLQPSPELFSKVYLRTYHAIGFAAAEKLAAGMRRIVPSWTRRKTPCVPRLALVSPASTEQPQV